MEYPKINIWELGDKINVKCSREFIDYINNEIKLKFRTKRKIHQELNKRYPIPFSTFKDRMKRSYKYFIDLEILLNLCELLKIPLETFQKNIIAYKTRSGWNYIEDPKLPIELNPLFDMLIAHHIGDGNPIDPKRNRKIYFSYRQYDDTIRKLYLHKVEALAGKISYRKIEYFKNTTQIYLPTVLANLFFNQYDLKYADFISDTARIPLPLFEKDWKCKLAFLLGLIIDEGYVDSTVLVIGLKNPNLIRDLKKLCESLGYTTTVTRRKNYEEYAYIYILKKGMIKLWQDYLKLKKEFPQIDLGYKEEQIKDHLRITERKIKRIPGNKKIILDLLTKKELCVNDIAHTILMTRQGVRFHIHNLEKEGKIKIAGIKGGSNLVYSAV